MSEPGRDSRPRFLGIFGALALANAAAWGCAWVLFGGSPALLGTAFLAYTFGLRHAVDADHIAAIDNATRKLIELQRPAATTGLWFSLGHGSFVVLASIALAAAAAGLRDRFAPPPWANDLATGFSALCLFAFAIANSVVLLALYRIGRAARRGEPPDDAELGRLLARRGLLGWALRRVFGLVTQSWHMYPVGFLFALGFDTATEIGVLGVSAAAGSRGVALPVVVVFSGLFAAGMALVDALDASLMAAAYRWAAAEPFRRMFYNLTVTSLSVVVAAAIGAVELLGLYAERAATTGGFWHLVEAVNDHFEFAGIAAIALLAGGWAAAWSLARASEAVSRAPPRGRKR